MRRVSSNEYCRMCCEPLDMFVSRRGYLAAYRYNNAAAVVCRNTSKIYILAGHL